MQCNAMQCNAMQCNAMQCNAMQCNTIQYNTIQYNTIQYNTIQYNTIQYNTIQYNKIQYNTIQYNTIQYNTIQYNTIDCCTAPGNQHLFRAVMLFNSAPQPSISSTLITKHPKPGNSIRQEKLNRMLWGGGFMVIIKHHNPDEMSILFLIFFEIEAELQNNSSMVAQK
jgi:hypothetical protein